MAEGGQDARREEHRGSFRSHLQYLSAITTTIRQYYSGRLFISPDRVSEALARSFRDRLPDLKLQRRQVDVGTLRRVLVSAWGTEFMLWSSQQMTVGEEEVTALANQWGVVQAYYGCAYAAQAAGIAQGNPRPDSHPKTQGLFVELWVDSYGHFPPWSLGLRAEELINWPPGVPEPESIHPWAAIDDRSCWPLSTLALRSTRRDLLKQRMMEQRKQIISARRRAFLEAQEDRKRKNQPPLKEPVLRRPQITDIVRADIDRKQRATTLLDYLYRLRTRSNYEDPQVFFEGPTNASEAQAMHRQIRHLTSWTFLLHELLVRELAGRDVLRAAAEQWLKNPVAASAGFGLRRRWHLLFS